MADERVRGHLPPDPKRITEIRRVKNTQPVQYVCFSKSIFGQLIHWHSNRSHECTADRKACEGCKAGWACKWLGYLHVQAVGEDADVFLEITNIAFHKMDKQVPKGQNLRGIMFRISKTKGGARGRFLIEVLERRLEERELIEERDPAKVLKFLWSCKRPVKGFEQAP